MTRPAPMAMRVSVLFDTAGFLGSLPLTGAAARTLHLNRHLHASGCPTTLLLCDLNPDSRPTARWPLPIRYLDYETVYERPDQLTRVVEDTAPDVLVLSNTQLMVRYGRALAEATGSALVYEMHDDETAVLRSLCRTDAEQRTAAFLQAAAINAADTVIAFTKRDAEQARNNGASHVHVVPCGVTLGEPPTHKRLDRHVAFVGNLYYEPNLRAVRYLTETLAPRLDSCAQIDVFGRYPAAVQRHHHAVRLHGPVANLRTALDDMAVGIAPLDSGGGMKLKVLDYMAAGLPIVGTAEAFAGMDGPERFALVSTDSRMRDVPELVNMLLSDEGLRARLGRAGRSVAERHHGWPALARRARRAYSASLVTRNNHTGGQPHPDAVRLSAQPPYWLIEWRSRRAPGQKETTMPPRPASQTGSEPPGEAAEAIECARIAAQSALGLSFTDSALVGYGGRSLVYLSADVVLKVYTHRPAERASREIAGITAASHATGVRVPRMISLDTHAGAVAWVACTRLPGSHPTDARLAERDTAVLLGRVAARIHSVPAAVLTDLAAWRRRIRDLPTGADRAAADLTSTLRDYESERRACQHGLVHGDFSSRNVLLTGEAVDVPGLIDFEGSGHGCVYNDLASLVLHDGLLGTAEPDALLAGYEDERAALDVAQPGIVQRHLWWHIGWRIRWILQWSQDIDPQLTTEVAALIPTIVAHLTAGAES